MDLHVDHVTVAGRDLDALSEAYTEAGLPTEYGGKHSNDVTHMSVVGFRDGTYVELIAAFDGDATAPWWDEPIRRDGGPCAWAVGVDDIETVTDRLRDRGIAVDGPHPYQREREDGSLVKWRLTFLGGDEDDPGRTLPFLIKDETPRERRVQPTGELANAPITGVEKVVLAVPDRRRAADRFRTAFDLTDSYESTVAPLDADAVVFPDSPVVLAEPTGPGWLHEHLDAFGPRPAAYLLGGDADAAPCDVLRADGLGEWTVSWLSLTEPIGRPYLGVLDDTP